MKQTVNAHAMQLSILLAVGALATGCSSEQRLTVTATAFNSTRAQTDGSPRKTACGTKLQPGDQVIAISRDLAKQGLVCGSQLKIDRLDGTWTVVDLTAARHKRRIDIYMGRDVKAARAWGVQKVDIRWSE